MKTEFGCNLWIITENDSPDIVTEITGICPMNIEKKGKPKIHRKTKQIIPNVFYKQNIWTYESKRIIGESDWDLIYASNEILEMIEKNKRAFMEVFKLYQDKCLQFYCYESNYNISFRVQPEVWQRIAPYNLMIDFDLYALGDDEED